ncbi:MAG TPA: aminopeptidase [Verrucomicrobiae bacterium]|nr:aminopeptidase [Verrucomicrobiae bacterium]
MFLSFTLVRPRFLIAVLLLCAVAFSGCSPTYVMRAAYEEGKILWRREPIEEALKKPDLDPKTRDKFELVLAAREYARDKLKFNVKGSYASYSFVDRQTLSYVLMAVPKTDLKPYMWWFMIVGNVPYKGYFSQDEALAEAKRFEKDGYDTYIRTSAAFSTLGWFDDPLLAHLLRFDKVTLADTIFHELFHNTLYVGSAGAFNESLANFVGAHAAISFFRDRYGEGSPEHLRAISEWQEELEFSRFLTDMAASLGELYAKKIPLKETLRLRDEVFSRAQKSWAEEVKDRPDHRYRSFAKVPLNNAVLAQHMLYLRDLDLFESVYQLNGKDLARSVASIKDIVKAGGDPYGDVRVLAQNLEENSLRAANRLSESPNRVNVIGNVR